MKRIPFFLFLVFAALLIAGIVALKMAADPTATEAEGDASGRRQSLMARPDTSVAADAAVPESETFASPADSLSVDTRPCADAGYEDGYLQGMDDGALGLERGEGYDDSSAFPARRQREEYAAAYREGYANGYADGRAGRQFNIE